MQFEPDYKPFKEAIKALREQLTDKQRLKYDSHRGYFADSLRKASRSKKTEVLISEVETIRDQCEEDFNEAFDEFADNFSGVLKARVCWFDDVRGQGMVKITGKDGETVRSVIYACAIKGRKTWYPETACVYYEENQDIEVELSFRGRLTDIDVIGLTQGHFDREGWNNLDQDSLAFKCNEQGEAINGLFAQSKGN